MIYGRFIVKRYVLRVTRIKSLKKDHLIHPFLNFFDFFLPLPFPFLRSPSLFPLLPLSLPSPFPFHFPFLPFPFLPPSPFFFPSPPFPFLFPFLPFPFLPLSPFTFPSFPFPSFPFPLSLFLLLFYRFGFRVGFRSTETPK